MVRWPLFLLSYIKHHLVDDHFQLTYRMICRGWYFFTNSARLGFITVTSRGFKNFSSYYLVIRNVKIWRENFGSFLIRPFISPLIKRGTSLLIIYNKSVFSSSHIFSEFYLEIAGREYVAQTNAFVKTSLLILTKP